MGEVVEQAYWNDSYKNFNFYIENDAVSQFCHKYIRTNMEEKYKKCFEVGCFPGRYLAGICKEFDFEANGIDRTCEMEHNFIEWLVDNGITVGTFIRDDVHCGMKKLEEKGEKYDIVYSLGFIEHFTDFEEVIMLHDKILKDDGVLIITTPNFRGVIQYILHWLFDKKNMKRHVIASMKPSLWEKIIQTKSSYEIMFCGYFGGFDFWLDEYNEKNFFMRNTLAVCNILKKKIRKNHASYSPYCGIVAKKKKYEN